MPKNKEISNWEFSKYSVQRNDEAIRFSEVKATILFSLVGLLIGGVFNNIEPIKSLLISKVCIIRSLSFGSLIIIGIGLLLLIVSSILVILPRLHVINKTSFLFFGDNYKLQEDEIKREILSLDTEKKNDQIIAQIHATSKIAYKKFSIIRWTIGGTIIIIFGSLLLLTLYLFS